jgi:uncharacterized protein YggT (Ycf19 family)
MPRLQHNPPACDCAAFLIPFTLSSPQYARQHRTSDAADQFLLVCCPQLTDPFLNVFRGIIPAIGGIDLSPMLGFFLLNFVRNLLMQYSHVM